MNPRLFITYATQQADSAERLSAALSAAGVENYLAWRTEGDRVSSDSDIDAALEGIEAVLILRSSAADSSRQVIREVERAKARGLRAVTLRLEALPASGPLVSGITPLAVLDAFPKLADQLPRIATTIKSLFSAPTAAPARKAPARGDEGAIVDTLWSGEIDTPTPPAGDGNYIADTMWNGDTSHLDHSVGPSSAAAAPTKPIPPLAKPAPQTPAASAPVVAAAPAPAVRKTGPIADTVWSGENIPPAATAAAGSGAKPIADTVWNGEPREFATMPYLAASPTATAPPQAPVAPPPPAKPAAQSPAPPLEKPLAPPPLTPAAQPTAPPPPEKPLPPPTIQAPPPTPPVEASVPKPAPPPEKPVSQPSPLPATMASSPPPAPVSQPSSVPPMQPLTKASTSPPAQPASKPPAAVELESAEEMVTLPFEGAPPPMDPLPMAASPADLPEHRTRPLPPASSFSDGVDELRQHGAIDAPPRPGVLGRIDHYELIKKLGEGGMGIVLLARDTRNDALVALKTMRPKYAANAQARHRFVVEARHMQRMDHPNVLKVLDVSDREEGCYYATPLVAGGSLAAQMESDEPMLSDTVLRIGRGIADALRYAHDEAGVIHRDIKPQNVLIDTGGRALLSDFGLVRTLFNDTISDEQQRSWTVGTGPYMPPEIVAGKAGDTRADIYSFGAMLYEMSCGRSPYQGQSTEEVLTKIKLGPPLPVNEVNPNVSPALAKVIAGCMGRELRDRYAHMADVAEDLRRVQIGQEPLGPHGAPPRAPAAPAVAATPAPAAPAAPVPVAPAPPPAPPRRSSTGILAAAIAAVVVLAGLGIAGYVFRSKLPWGGTNNQVAATAGRPANPSPTPATAPVVTLPGTGASTTPVVVKVPPTSPGTPVVVAPPGGPPSTPDQTTATDPPSSPNPPRRGKVTIDSSALQDALISKDFDAFQRLMASGNVDVNHRLPNHELPVRLAILRQREKEAVALINAGAKLDVVTPEGEPLIYTAARLGEVAVIKAMVAHHVDVDTPVDLTGCTPLYAAIYYDQPEAVKALLDLGANPDRPSKIAQETPRSVAATKGSSRVKQVLNTWVAPSPAAKQ